MTELPAPLHVEPATGTEPVKEIRPSYIGRGCIDASYPPYSPDYYNIECGLPGYNLDIVQLPQSAANKDNRFLAMDRPGAASTPPLSDALTQVSSEASASMDPRIPMLNRPSLSTNSRVVPRVASTQLSHLRRPLTVDALNHLLDNELMGAALTDSVTVIETVFPDAKLPVDVDQNLLTQLEGYTSKGRKILEDDHWVGLPNLEPNQSAEHHLASWLNFLGVALQSICEQPLRRKCTGRHSNTVVRKSVHV